MNTKEKLLGLLESNTEKYLSGEDIAEALGISRTAVWKAVNALRSDGCDIEAISNKGYRLVSDADVLSENGIRKHLDTSIADIGLSVYPVTDSTNIRVREAALSGAPEGFAAVAGSQTAGRGRLGRSFYSPSGTGLYLSLLLRPAALPSRQTIKITTLAAVAACEAIEAVSDRKAMIKWVNDIFIDGKKVSGILTEASFSLESDSAEYVILGIGFNILTPEGGFPEEIKNIAGAIFDRPQKDIRNRLAAEFISRFMAAYRAPRFGGYEEKYRARSLAVGHTVDVLLPAGPKEAYVLDVDDDCRLIVRYPDGTEDSLYSGEVSIKLSHAR
ncbi:MAG: biotin--[acetyl-CoA-carboxylase] ligase [Lachnospiraceae bacterium]|nr:biotin--[acetyl-CoA-carboxylase] ligase [Lachnospiraceae bacterium]